MHTYLRPEEVGHQGDQRDEDHKAIHWPEDGVGIQEGGHCLKCHLSVAIHPQNSQSCSEAASDSLTPVKKDEKVSGPGWLPGVRRDMRPV